MAKLIWLIAGAAFAASMAPAQEGPEQILQRAVKLHQSGDPEKAIPLYRQFLQVQPQAPRKSGPISAPRWPARGAMTRRLPNTGRRSKVFPAIRASG
jgi:hypothetical protein